MKVGVTVAVGFIGMHFTEKRLSRGHQVIGLDSLSPSYGVIGAIV